jgi:hypothetical protein
MEHNDVTNNQQAAGGTLCEENPKIKWTFIMTKYSWSG